MNHANEVTAIERILFGATRGVASAIAFISLVAIAVLLFFAITGFPSPTHVSYNDVVARIKQKATSSAPTGSSEAGSYSIPPTLKSLMVGDNQKVIQGWVSAYDDNSEKQDFVNNLDQVLSEAHRNGTNIADAANSYHSLKDNKLSQWQYRNYIALGERAAAVAGIVSLLFLLLLTSLVLVLLAIERHTRRMALSSLTRTANP